LVSPNTPNKKIKKHWIDIYFNVLITSIFHIDKILLG